MGNVQRHEKNARHIVGGHSSDHLDNTAWVKALAHTPRQHVWHIDVTGHAIRELQYQSFILSVKQSVQFGHVITASIFSLDTPAFLA